MHANDRDAAGDFRAAYACSLGSRWVLDIEEALRVLHTLEPDSARGRDLSHDLDVGATHLLSSRTELGVKFRQELSRASGDTLFDHDLLGASTSLVHRFGGPVLRGRLEWSRREALGGFFSDRDRWTGSVSLDRFTGTGLTYDATLRGARVDYSDNGEIAPSGSEGELSVHLSHEIGRATWEGGTRIELDARTMRVAYDDPDTTYASYDVFETGIDVYGPWTAPSVGIGARGEWLRPHAGHDGAYDQAAGTLHLGTFGPGELWVDCEASIGTRNYLGRARELGIGGSAGVLDLDSSDFWFYEVSLLGSYEWRSLIVEASAQSTTEEHSDPADDADFFLLNGRVGFRF